MPALVDMLSCNLFIVDAIHGAPFFSNGLFGWSIDFFARKLSMAATLIAAARNQKISELKYSSYRVRRTLGAPGLSRAYRQ
uniref:Uncharacterized protein n=1 Tax=mine drainage metagenome TaxID=410659 RepID=E6Q528_9ZZZZ